MISSSTSRWKNEFHEIQNMNMFKQRSIQVKDDKWWWWLWIRHIVDSSFSGDSLTKFLQRNEEIRACKFNEVFQNQLWWKNRIKFITKQFLFRSLNLITTLLSETRRKKKLSSFSIDEKFKDKLCQVVQISVSYPFIFFFLHLFLIAENIRS